MGSGMPSGRFRIKWLSITKWKNLPSCSYFGGEGSQFWGPGIYAVVGISPHVKFMRLKVTGIIHQQLHQRDTMMCLWVCCLCLLRYWLCGEFKVDTRALFHKSLSKDKYYDVFELSFLRTYKYFKVTSISALILDLPANKSNSVACSPSVWNKICLVLWNFTQKYVAP